MLLSFDLSKESTIKNDTTLILKLNDLDRCGISDKIISDFK